MQTLDYAIYYDEYIYGVHINFYNSERKWTGRIAGSQRQ